MSFADKVIHFNKQLTYTGSPLPQGIHIMNPFRTDGAVMNIVQRILS